MVREIFQNSFDFLRNMREAREQEMEAARQNPFLARALEREKYEGQRLAVFARTIALFLIAVLIPILNPRPDSLFYVAAVLLFIGIGWLQLQAARVGQSGLELALIFADLILMTALFVIPNPFINEVIPPAFTYRFDNFIYFFVIVAVGTLAYSWRTVWSMGMWIAIIWMLGLAMVSLFGNTLPGLTEASNQLYAGNELFQWALDPNGAQPGERVEEVLVIIIVCCILGIRGARSNKLLMEQASLAAERANLSRYFPASMVDTLASTDHDIGAVRNQDVAVLFTDIVGFTKYAERNTPEDVIGLLRSYHSLVESAVFQNGGTLDKYLGDGAMATFGTPETGPDDPQNALLAAQAILERTRELNSARKQQGLEEIRVSVGLHFGTVTLGDVGSARRLEFTVIGDTVNVASRLEHMSRELECQCVVSDELMKHASRNGQGVNGNLSRFEQKRGVRLRGRQTPIDVWTM